jgi:hypothetical protein
MYKTQSRIIIQIIINKTINRMNTNTYLLNKKNLKVLKKIDLIIHLCYQTLL